MRAARGQGENDPQPVRLVRHGGHVAVVRGGDRSRDGQPQAGAGPPGGDPGPVEAVEDAGELIRRDAGAVVRFDGAEISASIHPPPESEPQWVSRPHQPANSWPWAK